MNKRILVVEDNEISFRLAEYVLTHAGYQVEWANNGRKCLEKVKSTQYVCILMDVNMPELDGVETTKFIRRTSSPQQLPIIGITAEEDETKLELLIQEGMNGYLHKPYRTETLLAEVQRYCETSHSGTVLSVKPEWLNIEKILARTHDDLSLLKEITPIFIKQTPALLTKIAQSISDNKIENLKQQLHQLKGTLSHFTLEGPFKTTLYLETLVANNNTRQLNNSFAALEAEVEQLLAYLTQNLS